MEQQRTPAGRKTKVNNIHMHIAALEAGVGILLVSGGQTHRDLCATSCDEVAHQLQPLCAKYGNVSMYVPMGATSRWGEGQWPA